MTFGDFLASFLGAGIGTSLLGFVLKDWLAVRIKKDIDQEAMIYRSMFELKREACLDALAVVDSTFSHRPWTQNGLPVPTVKQPVNIAQARAAYNQLALTCRDPEVIAQYAKTLGLGAPGEPARTVGADAIVALRNAMRKELGFGASLAPPDRVAAWIASLDGAENNAA